MTAQLTALTIGEFASLLSVGKIPLFILDHDFIDVIATHTNKAVQFPAN